MAKTTYWGAEDWQDPTWYLVNEQILEVSDYPNINGEDFVSQINEALEPIVSERSVHDKVLAEAKLVNGVDTSDGVKITIRQWRKETREEANQRLERLAKRRVRRARAAAYQSKHELANLKELAAKLGYRVEKCK